MKVKQTPMKPLYVEVKCEKCPDGTYKHTGKFKTDVDPVKVQHVCTHCGDERGFDHDYPRVIFVSTGEPGVEVEMEIK